MVALKALQRTSRRGKRTRIGLDIGASGVRAVQIIRQAQPCDLDSSRDLDGYVVTNAASGDRSPSEAGASAEGGTGSGSALALGARIRTLIQADRGGRVGFRGTAVAAALATPDVEFHTLELPVAILHADEAEQDQVVKFEV